MPTTRRAASKPDRGSRRPVSASARRIGLEGDTAILARLLHEADQRFQEVYQDAPFAYDSLDADAQILDVNDAWLKLLGYQRDEVIGRWMGDFFAPDTRAEFAREWEHVKAAGVVHGVSVRYLRKDGSLLEGVLFARLTYDASGRVLRSHNLTYDVTERQRAAEALRRSEREKALILGALSDAVVYRDRSMRIVWANERACERYGYLGRDLVGSQCHQRLFERDHPCEGCPVERSLQSGRMEQGECAHTQGTCVTRAWPVRAAASEDVVGVVEVSSDVTEVRRLEREVLEVSTRERERIGRDLHDDLGQLLTGICFSGRALAARLGTRAPRETADATRLTEIAERALLLARNLAKGLSPLGLDAKGLTPALEELASTTEAVFGARCSVHSKGAPSPAPGTPSLHAYHVVQEAITNAIKHGGARTISVSLASTGDRLVITVDDDGCGFGPDGPPEPGLGSGMGLRLIRHRVTSLGGTVTFSNLAAGGARVRCSLPMSAWEAP